MHEAFSPFSLPASEDAKEGIGDLDGQEREPGFEGVSAASAAGTPFPSLYSHNCTEKELKTLLRSLTSGHKKTADLLRKSILGLSAKYGLERLGFLTLTFADHITDPKEAQKCWHSLRTHVLPRYADWIRIIERQKSGRIHYHLLVVLPVDIRTGSKFDEFEKGVYRSANKALRAEWAFWRKTAPKYRFGRTELLPVKSNEEGLSKYLGKYISKHIGEREERDKRVRLVEYSRGARIGSTQFAWHSLRATLWRLKLAKFAAMHGISYEQLPTLFGARWAYRLKDKIMAMRLAVYPSPAHARADGIEVPDTADESAPVQLREWVDGVEQHTAGALARHASWDKWVPPDFSSCTPAISAALEKIRHLLVGSSPVRRNDYAIPTATQTDPPCSVQRERDERRKIPQRRSGISSQHFRPNDPEGSAGIYGESFDRRRKHG